MPRGSGSCGGILSARVGRRIHWRKRWRTVRSYASSSGRVWEIPHHSIKSLRSRQHHCNILLDITKPPDLYSRAGHRTEIRFLDSGNRNVSLSHLSI